MSESFILLVEDNPDDVALAQRAFKRCRIDNPIVVAWDGVEALDFLFCRGHFSTRNPCTLPEIILLDLKLPKVDGLEVLQRVRIDPRTSYLPVIILTSSFEDKDRSEAFRLGANQYLRKPVLFDQFIGLVEQIKADYLDTGTKSCLKQE